MTKKDYVTINDLLLENINNTIDTLADNKKFNVNKFVNRLIIRLGGMPPLPDKKKKKKVR